MTDYNQYRATDFLKDDSFLGYVLLSNEEDTLFWNDFMSRNPDKRKDIEQAQQILKSIKLNQSTFSEKEKLEILSKINESIVSNKRKQLHSNIYRFIAAACITGLIAIFFIHPFTSEEIPVKQTANAEVPNEKDIQLILADEETIVFDENADITYKKGGKITSSTTQEVVSINMENTPNKYNKFIVPKGKKATYLVLEDGSKVWVNSGSTLEFPVAFSKDKREILVDGEIYIEVSKDAERPFYVRTSEMNIKVLGTRFNISAYKDDSSQSVVLVEGLVEVQSKDELKKKTLLPDHKLTVTKDEMSITQANAYDYISWKDGLLQFRSEPLSHIVSKLSRYYDVDIVCEADIENMKCSGKLILFDDLTDVLETISHSIPLEKTLSNNTPVTYEVNNRNIYIKKKTR